MSNQAMQLDLDSWVLELRLPRPSFADNSADAERLQQGLLKEAGWNSLDIDLPLLRQLPSILRQADFEVLCALLAGRRGALLLAVEDGQEQQSCLGLAVDLGTTSFTLRLLELKHKKLLAEQSFPNPQTEFGPDILSRIHFAAQPGNSHKLQSVLLQGISRAIQEVCASASQDPQRILCLALAGNTAMTHFFLNLPTYWMIREPYIPAWNKPEPIRTKELDDLGIHPGAGLFCFPNTGSYFGGDLFAGLLSSGLPRSQEICLLVDVGTNAEVVLGNQDWLIACAGAAGPALEGGVSEIGKQAGPGIIDRVKIDPESLGFELHTIDGLPPAGICGSGMIDLAAQLFLAGLLDFRGKFVADRCPECLVRRGDNLYLLLADASQTRDGQELLLGQAELDSLIRSKAAMYTILETLTSSVGVSLEEISTFYVAGAFGNLIDPVSAITIGMLPDLPLERFQPLGNSSLEGCARFLLQPGSLGELEEIENKITYLELNVNQDFMNRFSAAKFLPHTEKSLFPSVQELLR
ncbi:MAG: ASKHA domain-containing protein [Desulfohalobiaceae bacterium]